MHKMLMVTLLIFT